MIPQAFATMRPNREGLMRSVLLAVAIPAFCAWAAGGSPAYAQAVDPARAAAIALVRQQIATAAPTGELVAGVAGDTAAAGPPQLPRPRTGAVTGPIKLTVTGPRGRKSRRTKEITLIMPAAKDRIAHRVALGFAALTAEDSEASPEDHRVEAAAPVEGALVLAYAPAEGALPRQSTRALSAIEQLVEQHAEKHDVEPALAHALVQIESTYRPTATGANGEIGLMQISPKTARAIGYKGPPKALYDPDTNLTWGMRYLAKAQDLADGDLCGTLLRYNAGLDATRKTSASNKFCAKVKAEMARRG